MVHDEEEEDACYTSDRQTQCLVFDLILCSFILSVRVDEARIYIAVERFCNRIPPPSRFGDGGRGGEGAAVTGLSTASERGDRDA